MSDSITRDPNFRSQYDCGVRPDAEFEAALCGSPQPRIYMPPAPQPLVSGASPWVSTGPVRLR